MCNEKKTGEDQLPPQPASKADQFADGINKPVKELKYFVVGFSMVIVTIEFLNGWYTHGYTIGWVLAIMLVMYAIYEITIFEVNNSDKTKFVSVLAKVVSVIAVLLVLFKAGPFTNTDITDLNKIICELNNRVVSLESKQEGNTLDAAIAKDCNNL